MGSGLVLWQAAGFAFTVVLGTVLHFLYGWTGESRLVAAFAAVNESTWEHMKLLFFPMVLFAAVQSFYGRDYPHFWCAKAAGTATGLLLIPLLFYAYNGALGRSPDWVNIALFFVAAAGAYWLEYHLLRRGGGGCPVPWLGGVLLAVVGVLFVVFTFLPPQLPLFRDPVTGNYGI